MPTVSLAPILSKLRYAVYPAVEDYWRADAAISLFLDSEMPTRSGDSARCGPAALSALFGHEEVDTVVATLDTPWMNRRSMESCLKRLGATYTKLDRQIPAQGVALIQRIGTMKRKDFRGSFLADTHWIAVVDDFVFDVNWPSWIPCSHWKGLVAEPLARQNGGVAWRIVTGYEIMVPLGGGQQDRSNRSAIWSQAILTE